MSITSNKPQLLERLVALLSYLTTGLVGFVWLILGYLKVVPLTNFMMYHIIQSIIISISYVLLGLVCEFLFNFLSLIPIVNVIVAQIAFFFNSPIFLGYSIIQLFVYSLFFYLAITSLFGIYTKIPWVSDVINLHVR